LPENGGKWLFFSIQGFFTKLAQLLITGLEKGQQKGPLSNIFSTSFAVPHFINGSFEIPEQLHGCGKSLERKRIHKRV